MSDQSKMSKETTSKDSPNATSSPESADGVTRSDSQAGPTTVQSGLEVVRVSPSVSRAKSEPKTMTAISGQLSANSSGPITLQTCLENKLRARLDVNGSPEYSLIWKRWNIDGQEPICALRASPLRIGDSVFTGWPTATVNDSRNGRNATANRRNANTKHHAGKTLVDAAQLSGWMGDTDRTRHAIGIRLKGNDGTPIKSDARKTVEQTMPWSSYAVLLCQDGKLRRFEPSSFPLADGIPGRVGLLRGYGNAIVPQVAAEFIIAAEEALVDR